MKHDEDVLQTSIVAFLRLAAPTHFVFAVPNGGFRRKQEAVVLKRTGVVAGVPDLCLIGPCGTAHFFEVKTKDGVVTKAQREIKHLLMTMAVPCAVVRSIDDVKTALAYWKIPTRQAA